MQKKIFIFLLFFSIFITFVIGNDVYIAPFKVDISDSALDPQSLEKEKKQLNDLFQLELNKVSSDFIIYKPTLESNNDQSAGLKNNYIRSTLDAMALCFFKNINYLIYGNFSIESKNNQYSVSVKLYSKDKHAIIYEKDFQQVITDQKTYIKEIVATLGDEINTLFISLIKEKELAKIAKKDNETVIKPENMEAGAGKALETVPGVVAPQLPEDQKKVDKLVGFWVSMGYFFTIQGEWKELVTTYISVEQGPKFLLNLVDTENFNLIFRPGFLINYSFSSRAPSPYTRYHSIITKIPAEISFEFLDFFNIFLGGGPLYRFDFINYQTTGLAFFTDIPFALGIFGNYGIEFILSRDKSFSLGITNTIDATFFSTVSVDYRILLHCIFQI